MANTQCSLPGLPDPFSLRRYRDRSILPAEGFKRAMGLCGFIPDSVGWATFLSRAALVGGVLFLTFSLAYFIGWNWSLLHYAVKLGLIQSVLALFAFLALRQGLESASGQILLLACGAMFGPLFAQFGQTWQSGQDTWMLYAAWASLLAPLAVIGRNTGLWILFWLTASYAVFSWSSQDYSSLNHFLATDFRFPAFQLLFLVLWQAGRAFGHSRTFRPVWPSRLAAFCGLASLSLVAGMSLLGRTPEVWKAGSAILVILAIGWWARYRGRDLFVLGCAALSMAGILIALLFRPIAHGGFDAVILWLIASFAIMVGTTVRIHTWHKSMHATSQNPTDWRLPGIGSLPDWPSLSARLVQEGYLPAGTVLAPSRDLPVGIRLLQGLGGWLASLFLFAAIIAMLFLSGARSETSVLLVLGLAALVPGAFLCRQSGPFAAHFGLSAAMAGTAAICAAACFALSSDMWPVALACINLAAYFLVSHRAFRVISGCVIILSLLFSASSLGYGDLISLDRRLDHPGLKWLYICLDIAMGALVCVPMTLVWIWEDKPALQRCQPWLEPAAVSLFSVMLCLSLSSLWLNKVHLPPMVLLPNPWGITVAAGISLVLVAHPPDSLRAFGRSLAVSALFMAFGVLAASGLLAEILPFDRWMLAAAPFAITGLVALWFARRKTAMRPFLCGLGIACLCVALGYRMPGLALCVLGLAIGRGRGRPVLFGVCSVFLIVCMVNFFQRPYPPQAVKFLVCLGVGSGLCLIGWMLPRLGFGRSH